MYSDIILILYLINEDKVKRVDWHRGLKINGMIDFFKIWIKTLKKIKRKSRKK